MKQFTFKWLKRFYVLIAIKLFIFAALLTILRILFISIDDYKEDTVAWLIDEYNFDLSVEDISAGVDFSGVILILNDIELLNSDELPFLLSVKHLFLHLDLWNSILERNLNFKNISLQGVDLTIKEKEGEEKKSEQSLLTLDSLQTVFLQQLNKFSIKESELHFTDQFGNNKTIVIEKLRWLNEGEKHQGIGSATIPNRLAKNALTFVIDLSGEPGNLDDPLTADLYVEADNFNITDYLSNSINQNAQMLKAILGFQLWAEFSADKVNQIQMQIENSQIAWAQSNNQHNWQLKSGLLQLTNSSQGWLLDSYDLDFKYNQKKLTDLSLSGYGTQKSASFNFNGVSLKNLIPFYLLYSELDNKQIHKVEDFSFNGQLKHLSFVKNHDNQFDFKSELSAFSNNPKGVAPGISNANIELHGDINKGEINIELPKQKIYFDGQFNRAMPVESASIKLQWRQLDTGFKLFSEKSLLTTSELDTVTAFSLFFPNKKANNQSPFLSLYSYASLNDAGKAQYYFPIKAMGDNVFDYLQPTLKKGNVKGAKILWYGAFNHYPYDKHNGIFQAWVPLRNAQYDFYGQWQGLTDLDLDLLFENDGLTMQAQQASLGGIKIDKLTAKVDHLNPDSILIINADITEDAQKISDYLKASPLKASVGNALNIINIENKLTAKLQISIPFNRKILQTETIGEINLVNNKIQIELAENLYLPLENLNGTVSFINGNLIAKNLNALLFQQPFKISFASIEKQASYHINADINGSWNLSKLGALLPSVALLQLSGDLEWQGDIKFEYTYAGGYQYDVVLNSASQGVKSQLPLPFYKSSLQSWPSKILLSGDQKSSKLNLTIKDKLAFTGELDYQYGKQVIPYFSLNIGQLPVTDIDTTKHIINVKLDQLNLTQWYQKWSDFNQQNINSTDTNSLFELDEIAIDINELTFLDQPLSMFKVEAFNKQRQWIAKIDSDKLQGSAEYKFGLPVRIDLDIQRLEFDRLDFSAINKEKGSLLNKDESYSDNLRTDFPEIFVKCETCLYGNFNFSPVKVHIFPTKSSLNIDYIQIGDEEEFTKLSGVWNQRRTNMIIDSLGNSGNSLVKRLDFASPVVYKKAEFSGAFNWIGAPWQFNLDTLNGKFSVQLTDGSITEVSDKGARLLSLFSLDGIRRSLNFEFGGVFDKGFNFDNFTLSANITDGIVKNDDFYLDGSAGKITGQGLIDLPNQETNYKLSYSPAVTSSLPVLTAFAINPLTGAAVLVISKLLEPVVETIIRVDFSVKGAINNPEVKLINRQRGSVKLQNSEVLEKMQRQNERGKPSGL